MKIKGWLSMMFVGAIIVNGLICFMPALIFAQNQSPEETGLSQEGEETREMMPGVINSFDSKDTIVISDMTFHFSKRTRFYNKYGTHIPGSRLKVNDYVVFFSVDGNLEEVRQMDPKDVQTGQQLPLQATEQNNGRNKPVHLEDGVWKN